MGIMDEIFAKARVNPKKVAFPEAENETMLRAAFEVAKEGIARSVLVGNRERILNKCCEIDIAPSLFKIVDNTNEEYCSQLVERYTARDDVLLGAKAVKRRLANPLYMALVMEAVDDVDITFAGIETTTGEVILAGQTIVGLAEGIVTPSSVALFEVPGFSGSEGNLLAFGDSAVCVDPDAEQLASIAVSACDSVRALLGWDPRCALLSFSTDGSAEHELADKVINARKIANEKRPDLKIDGEFQLDAAINAAVGAAKVKRESEVAGKANIIIWPDLNAGNIGVKLVQQFAGGKAYGPMLQGFRKIVCDCSRSANVEEIVGNVAMGVVRAGK